MLYHEYWCWHEEIPHKICQKIINLGKKNWSPATTLDNSFDNIRKSDVVWVRDQWIYDLIWTYMMFANENAGWKYDIVAAEDCQITRYTKNEFYEWHKDGIGSHNEVINEPDNEFLHGNTRKLSMSIVLNSNFEGGNFEIRGENKISKLKEGSVIVFPSFMVHRVAPVTKGTRYSLVAWFIGPPFK